MPPKKRGRPSGTGGDPPPFDPEAMETMIQERITAALVAYELAHPTGGGGGGGGDGGGGGGGGGPGPQNGGNPKPCTLIYLTNHAVEVLDKSKWLINKGVTLNQY